MATQKTEPLVGESLAACPSEYPDTLEVAFVADVLCDGDRGVEVEDTVPPSTRDEDGLTWVLNALNHVWQLAFGVILSLLEPWEGEIEVVDSLIILALLDQVLAADEFLGDAWAWREHHPPLVALDGCVPR